MKVFFGKTFPKLGGWGGWFPPPKSPNRAFFFKPEFHLLCSQISQKPRGWCVGSKVWESFPKKNVLFWKFLQDSSNFCKIQHVLYFLNAGGSRISNMTFQCVMKVIKAMKVMRISAFLCISLNFSAFLCISIHFSSFLYISEAILCISLNFLCISLRFSAFLCISLHFFAFLCISLDSIAVSLFTIFHYYHYYHYYSPLFTIITIFTVNRYYHYYNFYYIITIIHYNSSLLTIIHYYNCSELTVILWTPFL